MQCPLSMLSGERNLTRTTSGSGRSSMKKHTKKSSFKKGKSTHRGSSAVATQRKKKRRKGMDPENVTSWENLYTHEELEESNKPTIPVTLFQKLRQQP